MESRDVVYCLQMECDGHAIKTPTTGVFDFPSLILGGKGKYVDKTDLLYRLCNDADQQLFISRPRRFGKSLMLSTLKAMFEGRRVGDVWRGLAADRRRPDGYACVRGRHDQDRDDYDNGHWVRADRALMRLHRGSWSRASAKHAGTGHDRDYRLWNPRG